MVNGLIMWSIGQIAERDGVSKAAISKAVKKLIEQRPETPKELDGQGRVLLVSVAHYDEFRQRFVNPAKATAPIRSAGDMGGAATSPQTPPLDPAESFEEARRVGEWLKVHRERIRHQEAIGQLVRKDKIDEAIVNVGGEIKTELSRIANFADDLALAVSKEGVHGARLALRKIAFEIGNRIADRLAKVAAGAPATDAMIDADDAGQIEAKGELI